MGAEEFYSKLASLSLFPYLLFLTLFEACSTGIQGHSKSPICQTPPNHKPALHLQSTPQAIIITFQYTTQYAKRKTKLNPLKN